MQNEDTQNRINDPIKNTASNCHKPRNTSGSGSSDSSDQDSSTSKYVVQHDHRERKDGPGGN